MANTYALIASGVVGSGGAGFIDFSNIPNTYTDLHIKYSLRAAAGTGQQGLKVEINNSDLNQLRRILYSDNGTTITTYNDSSPSPGWVLGTSITANHFSHGELQFPNYTVSQYKAYTGLAGSETGDASSNMGIFAMNWTSTTAINQITLKQYGGNFAQYSTAYLYGIKNT